MGRMLFHAPTPDVLPPGAVEQAYIAGIEGVPWRSHNSWADGLLVVERGTAESGCLHIPWEIAGSGTRMLSTCNLMERDEPYCLATELARGTLYRLRRFADKVSAAGFDIPIEVGRAVHVARQNFFAAITSPFCENGPGAKSICQASGAIERLCQSFNQQFFTMRRRDNTAQGPVLAGKLHQSIPRKSSRFLEAFNGALLPFSWRDLQADQRRMDWEACDAQVAWCRQHGLHVFGGPLAQIDPLHLPDWAWDVRDDFDALERHLLHFVDSVVRRYEDQIDAWISVGRANLPRSFDLDEEQKLRLAVTMVETLRRASPRTPVVVGFDQPWGEYLGNQDGDLSPLYFADALVRADLGVAGIALEINLGYWPNGTQPRDLLDVLDNLERWGLLGIPLIILLTVPAGMEADERAIGTGHVVAHSRARMDLPAVDHNLVADLVATIATCPRVHAVVWNQWSDLEPHEYANSGLLDTQGRERPAVASLVALRQTVAD